MGHRGRLEEKMANYRVRKKGEPVRKSWQVPREPATKGPKGSKKRWGKSVP